MARLPKYTAEMLAEAVAASTSVAGVLRALGLPQAGGTHAHVSRRIKHFEIDTGHFVRFQNGAHRARLTAEQVLVRRPKGAPRAKPYLLRRALLELGRPYRCAGCGNAGEWCGQSLRLEVDHIDGDFHNNEPENLRFLCPNCHSLTSNWCGRSRGKWADAVVADTAERDGTQPS